MRPVRAAAPRPRPARPPPRRHQDQGSGRVPLPGTGYGKVNRRAVQPTASSTATAPSWLATPNLAANCICGGAPTRTVPYGPLHRWRPRRDLLAPPHLGHPRHQRTPLPPRPPHGRPRHPPRHLNDTRPRRFLTVAGNTAGVRGRERESTCPTAPRQASGKVRAHRRAALTPRAARAGQPAGSGMATIGQLAVAWSSPMGVGYNSETDGKPLYPRDCVSRCSHLRFHWRGEQ